MTAMLSPAGHARAADVAADRAENAAYRGDQAEADRQAGLARQHADQAGALAARHPGSAADVDATDADRAAERAQAEADSASR